jgi:hypothetical protein
MARRDAGKITSKKRDAGCAFVLASFLNSLARTGEFGKIGLFGQREILLSSAFELRASIEGYILDRKGS